MDYNAIQVLALEFKASKPGSRLYNQIFNKLVDQYAVLCKAMASHYTHSAKEYSQFRQTFSIQLLFALQAFDKTKHTQFNTFAFYYLSATARLYMKEKLPPKDINYVPDLPAHQAIVDEWLDFYLDIDKILDKEELFVLNAYMTKFISESSKTQTIRTKIEEYIRS